MTIQYFCFEGYVNYEHYIIFFLVLMLFLITRKGFVCLHLADEKIKDF